MDYDVQGEDFLAEEPSLTGSTEPVVDPSVDDEMPQASPPQEVDSQALLLAAAQDDEEGALHVDQTFASTKEQLENGNRQAIVDDVVKREQKDYLTAAYNDVARHTMTDQAAVAASIAEDFKKLEALQKDINQMAASDKEVAAATRAADRAATITDPIYMPSGTPWGERAARAGEYGGLSAHIQQAAAARGLEFNLLHAIEEFGISALPVLWLGYEKNIHQVAEKAVGHALPVKLNQWELISTVRETYAAMDQEGRERLVKVLLDEDYGLIGDNENVKQRFLEMLMAWEPGDAAFGSGMTGLGIAVDAIPVLGAAMRVVKKLGSGVSMMRMSGGARNAGKMAGDAMTRGSEALKAIGLNDAEAMGQALSAGRLPHDSNPLNWAGTTAEMQERLRSTFNQIVGNEVNRINASGMSTMEKAERLSQVEGAYKQFYGKHVHSMEWKDGKLVMRIQDESGQGFKTVEALQATKRRFGLGDDIRIITEDGLEAIHVNETRSMMKAFHGGDTFEWFRKEFVGRGQGGNALGHGFYASLTREMAERFARGRVPEGKAAQLYELALPDAKHFLDFDKGFTKQSAEVKKALAAVLNADELKALKSKMGREVYDTLAERLGGQRQASEMLDAHGIAGNTGRTLGAAGEREFLVFNERLMNDSIVSRRAVKGGMSAAEKAAMKEAERELDEKALALLDDTEFSPVQQSINTHSSVHNATPAVRETLRGGGGLTDLSKHLWSEGERFYSGPAVNQHIAKWGERFKQFLGMENERLLLVAEQDLELLRHRPEFKKSGKSIDGIKEKFSMGQADGTYSMSLNPKTGHRTHIVVLKNGAKGIEGITLLAHEMGHMFDRVFLDGLTGGQRAAMAKQFGKWLETKYGGKEGLIRFANRQANPTPERVADLDKLVAKVIVGDSADPDYLRIKAWYADFGEYVAEQMSKYAITDTRALSVADGLFKRWAQHLQSFYKRVFKAIGASDFVTPEVIRQKPDEWFTKMMNKHIDSLREQGRGLPIDAMEELDFTKTAASIKVAGKPNIKPKSTASNAPGSYLMEVEMDDSMAAIKGYDATDISGMPWIALDPRHAVSTEAMQGRVIGVHQTARTRRDFQNMLKKPLGALNRKERKRVLAVLEEGDQASVHGGYGKEFTPMDLYTRGFNDKEVEAYMTVRMARMVNYFIHNRALVDSMRAKGLKEITVTGQGKFAGRALALEDTASLKGEKMWDAGRKEWVELDPEAVYNSGARVIKTHTPQVVSGQEVTHFIARENEAQVRTIHTALTYRPGEFARIYNDPYFVRVTRKRMVDGVLKNIEMPVRTAATEREAKEWIDTVKEGVAIVEGGGDIRSIEPRLNKFYDTEEFVKMVTDGELSGFQDARFHFTREIDDYLGQTLESHSGSGKLFTRDRGEHILTADRTREQRANILNPYESLSREISMVSNFANINEWKETQVRKWMATFGDMLGSKRSGDDVADFFKAAGASFSHVTGKRGLFAERTHRYIMRQIGIQTDEHRWWQSLMRRVGEGAMPYVGEGVGAMIRDANPLNFVRGINHHLTLGSFNFSQLIVQANGMAIAASIHPVHGLKAAGIFPALRLALMSDNPEVWARIGKVAGEDVGRVAAAIRRAGLIDNLRSTSLHNIEDGKMDIFRSMPARGLATVKDAGAFFFNRGEEFSRIVSFDIARREWQKLNPSIAFDSDEAMEWILTKTDDFTQNMTRANLARWQEGVMSIPTQFLQFNIKLLQNITTGLIHGGGKGRGFTRAEALKALAGSVLLYGAAGMGMSNIVGEWIPDEVEQKMDPLTKTAIGQGMLAALFKAVGEGLGAERFDVALGQRLGSINFFTDLVYNAYYDPANVWEAVLGPTKSTGERLRVVSDVVNLWRRMPEVTLTDVSSGAFTILAEQVSSLRNATKAYLAMNARNRIINRKGEAIAEVSSAELLAQAFGLAPSATYDAYQMISSERAHRQALDEIAERVVDVQSRLLEAQQNGDEDLANRYQEVLTQLYPDNIGDFQYIQRKIRDRIAPFDTRMQKLLHNHAVKASTDAKPFMTTKPTDKVQ